MNGDSKKTIENCRNDLEKVKKYIVENPFDSMCQYLVSYSVIRACGTIEVLVKKIIFDRLTAGAITETVEYLKREIIDSSWNPSCGKIQNLLDRVNSRWSQKFQTLTNGTKYKSDLRSLVDLRNEFAHGQTITASINNIVDYFNGSCEILNILITAIKNEKD